jgi:hypothetical protein
MKIFRFGAVGCLPLLALILISCILEETPSKYSEATSVRNRVDLKLQNSSYIDLIDSATIQASTAEMQSIGGGQGFIYSDRQEVFSSNEFDPPQYDRIFELSIYRTSGLLAYFGKRSGVDITGSNVINLRLIPHKVTASLSLSDILSPVPLNQIFNWSWTGDAVGGGTQNSIHYNGDTAILDSASRIHFTTQDSSFGNGSYVFRFKARSLDFGWRIPDSAQGKSLRLSYNPVAAPNRITLTRGGWQGQTTDFADSLEYMYEPELWHVVQIIDSAGTLGIYFDGIKLDFFHSRPATQYLSGLGSGGIGIGTRASGMKVSAIMGLR